jgi:hypothetical protein
MQRRLSGLRGLLSGVSLAVPLLPLGATPVRAADGPPQDAQALAKAFGARVGISAMSMSPNGRLVAFLVPWGRWSAGDGGQSC